MSHTTTIETTFHNPEGIKRAAAALGLACRLGELQADGTLTATVTEELFNTTETGVASVQLEGWQYPFVIRADGRIRADNYNGQWGPPEALDRFTQQYAQEVGVMELEAKGMRMLGDPIRQDNGNVVIQMTI